MKTVKKIRGVTKSVDERDQYLTRFPEGMRQALTALADENGRSINAEIVAALETHLRRKDRLTSLELRMESLDRSWRNVQQLLFEIAAAADRGPRNPQIDEAIGRFANAAIDRKATAESDPGNAEIERVFSELKATMKK
jgi:hypothetical protein